MYKKLLCLLCAFGFLANGYAADGAQVESTTDTQDVVSSTDTPADDSVASNETDVNQDSGN